MVFEGLTFNGMAAVREVLAMLDASWLGEYVCSLLPPLMATKIWRLSEGSDLVEVDEVAEDDRERMMARMERRRWRWLRQGVRA